MIELHGVTKRFGARYALAGVELTVPRGEVFGLLGHNGAGKSTAIGLMLGQVWPTRGLVRVCGWEVMRHRQKALERVGAIFETPSFYDYLSGWANLEILSHYTARTSPERIREVLAWVGLSGREGNAVRTYSHGMRARLALAQALLPRPEVLILDEPGDGLDPEGLHELRHTIVRLHRELGLTLLLSSHLLNEVEQLCTRIAVLRQGRKVFDGRLTELGAAANLVRLRVGDFGAAVRELEASRLITGARDGRWVSLASGVGSEVVVRRLVELGMPVFEVARAERTLEEFYLDLMKGSEPRSASPSDAPPPA